MDLRPDSRVDFTRTLEKEIIPLLRKQKGFKDEITFVNPAGKEAFAISLWDSKEHAEAYNRGTYAEVTRILSKLVEGTPQVKTYEVANSTFHNIAAKLKAA
jgi:heme-degrading monooxygenase HmoA